jgi:citrate synthase
MKKSDWIDAHAACARLGIKPQTLYAYVSRKQIRARSDILDGRCSLYSRIDVETLSRKKRRPRARADIAQAAIRWGEPVLVTRISEVRDGMLYLRDHSIEDCAESMTLEQVATLLCGQVVEMIPSRQKPVPGQSPFARAIKCLAAEAETAAPMQGQSPPQIAREAGSLISLLADACLGHQGDGCIHARIGTIWGLSEAAQDMVRRALVLLSDHELNPSTFAVRVCASTGASLPAALLAGMTTLSGPRHGGVASLANAALQAALEGEADGFLLAHAAQPPYFFGYGHPLYPEGDPRAEHLLRRLPGDARPRLAVEQLSQRLNLAPNIDAALAAIVAHFEGPQDAAPTLFAIGRLTGWVAHAMEQIEGGEMIRPRARYLPGS